MLKTTLIFTPNLKELKRVIDKFCKYAIKVAVQEDKFMGVNRSGTSFSFWEKIIDEEVELWIPFGTDTFKVPK